MKVSQLQEDPTWACEESYKVGTWFVDQSACQDTNVYRTLAAKKGKKRKADETEEGDEAAAGGPKKKAKKTATKVTKGRFKGQTFIS